MWWINRAWSNSTSFWRALSKSREYNEGGRFKLSEYNYVPFENNYNKLVNMFQTRIYHVNNTPYQHQSDKYTHELAVLQKELNFLHGRLYAKRVLLVFAAIAIYGLFIKEEEAKDWGDRFDLKFMYECYGEAEESSSEGDTDVDD